METDNTVERKGWIDGLKGLLILFVFLGHVTTNSAIKNWLSSFYMPCFFILSGWLMKKEYKLEKFLTKKVKGILLPYLFFSLIWILFCFVKEFFIASGFNIWSTLLSIVLPYSGRIGGNAYNLWFLPCLFLSQLLVAVWLYGKAFGKILSGIFWLACLLLGIFITPYCSLLYATALASIFVACGFYISNYLLPNAKKKVPVSVVAIIAGGGGHIVGLILNVALAKNTLDFSAASFGILPIYMLAAIGGSLFFIGIISGIKTFPALEYVGRNSLVYYALHYEVVAVSGFVLSKIINNDCLMTCISLVLVLLLTSLIVWLYNKLKIGKLFK